MKINKEIIRELKHCDNRFNNYLSHYSDFNGTVKEFVLLENITYNDKVWVLTRLATKEQNVKWSIKCALSVLYIFEEKYPDDNRPRLALEAVENYLKDPNAADAAEKNQEELNLLFFVEVLNEIKGEL